MNSTSEFIGVEDCVNGMRPRTCTLKCSSMTGELLEIPYNEIMLHMDKVEYSCNFLKNYTKNRELDRTQRIHCGRQRHNVVESVAVRTTLPTTNRIPKVIKFDKSKLLTKTAAMVSNRLNPIIKDVIEKLRLVNISVAHYDMRFLKPIDKEILIEIGNNFKRIITVEDGTVVGGLGSAVSEFLVQNNMALHLKCLGIPDRFGPSCNYFSSISW